MKNTLIYIPVIIFILFFNSLNAQEITMSARLWDYRYYQDDERIARKDLVKLLEKNTAAIEHWKKSNIYNTFSWLAFASEVVFAAWEVADKDNPDNNTATIVGVFGSLAAVLTFSFMTHNQRKKAILKYNEGLQKQSTFKLEPSKKGVGIVLRF